MVPLLFFQTAAQPAAANATAEPMCDAQMPDTPTSQSMNIGSTSTSEAAANIASVDDGSVPRYVYDFSLSPPLNDLSSLFCFCR